MRNTLLRNLLVVLLLLASLLQFHSCDDKSGTTPDNTDGTTPGGETTVFKRNTTVQNYVEYRNGNFPLIISVPHGGEETNSSFTVRTKQNTSDPSFTNVKDLYTIEFAHLVDSIFYVRTGKYAHVIICRLRRTYVDMNRQRLYAIPQGSLQEEIYDLYHNRIKWTRKLIEVESGSGLILDIHGHGHDIKQVELGYTVSAKDLNRNDAELMTDDYASKSSIYSLSKNNINGKSFVEILRGKNSFGHFLVVHNIPCIPHPTNLSPGTNEYFSGGYITSTYGSSGGGTVDAIQMEFDSVARSASRRKEYASNLVDAILEFIDANYQFKTSSVSSLPSDGESVGYTVEKREIANVKFSPLRVRNFDS